MAEPRTLQFADTRAIRDEVARLRRGATPAGTWTLAQAAWHLNIAPEAFLKTPPATTEPTDAEGQMQRRLDGLFAAGVMPGGLKAPPGTEPPADASEGAIDAFLASLDRLDAWPYSHVAFGGFGPIASDEFRRFIRIHAAHHLGQLVPKPAKARPTLRFANEAAMLADLAALRAGHEQAGNWTLAQIAFHLALPFTLPLTAAGEREADELTDAQRVRQTRWDYYIAHVEPPPGFEATSSLLPPADAADDRIDALENVIRAMQQFHAPFVATAAGAMPTSRARGFLLAHGAHHLAYLAPRAGKDANA